MRNVVVLLKGERGLAVLERLLDGGEHQVTAVVIPDEGAMRTVAARFGDRVPEILPGANPNSPDFVARLADLRPEILVAAGFGTILHRPLLEVARLGVINCHAGRVPKYRGGSPLNWQILNGETVAGISVLTMDEGIDTGPVLASAEIPLAPRETIATLHDRANLLFPGLVVDSLARRERGDAGTPQDEAAAEYWHQRCDADGAMDFRILGCAEADRWIRALTSPYPGAFAWWGRRKVRLLDAEPAAMAIRGVPGRIVWLQGRGPYLVCRDGALLLRSWRIEGEGPDRLATNTVLWPCPSA